MVHQWFSRHQLWEEKEENMDDLADMDNTRHIKKLFT